MLQRRVIFLLDPLLPVRKGRSSFSSISIQIRRMMMKSSVRPARSASSALLSSFEHLASYPPKLSRAASQLIHLPCPWRPRAVQKLRHVSRMLWSKMYYLHHLSNSVCEGILSFWIVIHWVFQKIDLPRCELFYDKLQGFDLVQTLTQASETLARCSFHPGACGWGVEVLCCTPFMLRPFSHSNSYFLFTTLYAKLYRKKHTSGLLP